MLLTNETKKAPLQDPDKFLLKSMAPYFIQLLILVSGAHLNFGLFYGFISPREE